MSSGEYRVRIFNEALHASLLDPASPSSNRGKESFRNGFYSSDQSTTSMSRRRRRQAGQNREEGARQMKEMREQELARFEADCKRRVEHGVRRADAQRARRFQHLEQDIEEGRRYLDELDHEFNRQHEAKTMKLRKQYNEWDETVHSRIMNDIRSQIQAMDSRELLARKNDDMQKFLDTTNRKASIFRDIIIESEYDPLEPNRRSVKARVGTIEDPVKMVLNKHEQEKNMLTNDNQSGRRTTRRKPFASTTREVLDVQLWSTEKIKGTPHGIFSKMISTTNKAHNQQAAVGQQRREPRINFDHYNIVKGREAMQAELPKGKRTYETKPTRINIS